MKPTNDEGPALATPAPQEQTKTDATIVGEFVDKRNEDALQAEASALTRKLIRDIATGNESRSVTRNETKQAKGGRPRKHADAAARQAAYRVRNAGMLVDWRIDKGTVDLIVEISAAVDISATELANQMLKFALTNRPGQWRRAPMVGTPLPNAQSRKKKNKEGASEHARQP